jgi:ABC-2 type transport system ATP-binding protein
MARNGTVTDDYQAHDLDARDHPDAKPDTRPPREAAIEVEHVSYTFKTGTKALEDVSFTVPRGSIFGLLGPNGAGKTTLIRVMCGLLQPATGRAMVFGRDILRNPAQVRKRMCAHLQSTPVAYRTRVEELLQLFSHFYAKPMDVEALLALVGLTEKRREYFERLSEGQKQRLMIARALVGDPELLVLDEPTTGLDVAMRKELHQLIERLRDQGRTVVLSTHYMEEAELLCEQVAVLNRGRLFAVESPETLIRTHTRGEKLDITLSRPINPELLTNAPGVREVRPGRTDGAYVLIVERGERVLQHLVLTLLQTDVRLRDARIARPNLEQAYLQLTGEVSRP